jgi:anti-sigma regulatory factor (Ser/Thr protein kinase)
VKVHVWRSYRFAATDAAPSKARGVVRVALLAWEYDHDTAYTAALLTSELVTNAVRHAQPTRDCVVEFGVALDVFTLAVVDAGRGVPVPRQAAEDEESGRGLALVEELAADYGSRRVEGGKAVFFRLKVPPVTRSVFERECRGVFAPSASLCIAAL